MSTEYWMYCTLKTDVIFANFTNCILTAWINIFESLNLKEENGLMQLSVNKKGMSRIKSNHPNIPMVGPLQKNAGYNQ